jgi:hypothetical protein
MRKIRGLILFRVVALFFVALSISDPIAASSADSSRFDHYPVCFACVGEVGPDSGLLLSDMDSRVPIQNRAGGYWYASTDTAGYASANPSEFTQILSGATRDTLYPWSHRFHVTEGIGANSSYAAYIDFKLGKGSGTGVDSLEPFVVLGTKVSDDLGVLFSNFKGSTGLSFEYWTSAQSSFKFIRFEAKANQDFGNPRILFGLALPATQGQWKKATVNWNDLRLPDWVEIQKIPLADREINLALMDKIQWVVQEPFADSGASGAIAVDNVWIKGLEPISICASSACVDVTQISRAALSRRLIFTGQTHPFAIAPQMGKAKTTASIRLINVQGQVIQTSTLRGAGVKVVLP